VGVRWSDKTLAAVADLAGAVIEAPPGGSSRAEIALQALSQLIPYDCAVLCRADGESLMPVAATGYRSTIATAVAQEEYRCEQKALGMDLSGAALRFGDLPGHGRNSFTVTELAWPAGLLDGMGMSLRSGDGRFVGHIAVNAMQRGTCSDDHRDLLTLLNRSLGAAVGGTVSPVGSNVFGLTVRELTFLDLISLGHTNAEIADALVISQSTVRRHVEHLLVKLVVTTRTAAAVKANQHGLLGHHLAKDWSDDQ
jgi:DNA-binding CsgD family transcriptional regulator